MLNRFKHPVLNLRQCRPLLIPTTRTMQNQPVAEETYPKTSTDPNLKAGSLRALNLWQEHTNYRQNLKNLMASRDLDEKQRLFNQMVKELSQHEVAEEVVRPPWVHLLVLLRRAITPPPPPTPLRTSHEVKNLALFYLTLTPPSSPLSGHSPCLPQPD